MRLARFARTHGLFFTGVVALLVSACGGGMSAGTTGSGGSTSSSSTTTTTDTASSTSSTSGSGGGSGGSGPVLVPSGLSCSGASPSLANDIVAPITAPTCATNAACHTAMGTGSGFHDMLVNRIAEECLDNRLMVKASDPEHSYVIHKLTNHNVCGGQTMPKDAPLLATDQIQVIYDWICQGAQDN